MADTTSNPKDMTPRDLDTVAENCGRMGQAGMAIILRAAAQDWRKTLEAAEQDAYARGYAAGVVAENTRIRNCLAAFASADGIRRPSLEPDPNSPGPLTGGARQ